MRIINEYSAPTPEDLMQLKDRLGMTGNQMADLAGLAGGEQWRKYTGGKTPRSMSAQMLFYIAAQLVLEPKQIDSIVAKMRELGAEII
ncbi:XRE family transcriptional regulator (plasmid) [Rouxiella badensis]|uniref:Transcriptional regulator n=1 Tax=Rouxiella badensis TaxID=1646377 RepID=A0A1X0WAX3_9GAMM|nr:transcriptional regulator [Rouxiella badensis]ORJ23938.1 transcriptional regulator [Rouxiella badensis]WAT03187.1 XRE family transcriptional regulator [Rouxiella badensis]WAT03293.1 XRE family transcriptional regulator [Rouxiella badensis]